ncbi:MAG TPA: tagaturonate epimerase family protein [Verrucomicrobiae bacterium]|nr:tagaturonate epimerase family protein [Verrucomicrobiae bacterium]
MNTTSPTGAATRKTSPAAAPFAAKAVPSPTPLGLVKSFGFGDRFGLATPGHLAAAEKFDFAPIFAQQSIRELERTQRTAQQVVKAAITSLTEKGYAGKWGADADHLKTTEHVDRMSAAGFCFFTIDPSEHVGKGSLTTDLESAYLSRKFDVPNVGKLQFDSATLRSAAVKYGRALDHVAVMGRHIAKVMDTRPFEIEVSVDETSDPTSVLDHLFIGLELRRLAVPRVVSVAPRFIGEFEKGIDYKGDLKKFEAELRQHLEIARYCGPYKISVHSGSDKFAIYPIVGRVCGQLLHVKTSGTSYLEGLRVVARTMPKVFAEIVEFCRGRFETDRQSYHISTTLAHVNALPKFTGPKEEAVFLDEVAGRQLLHVTFGSVLTHPDFKPRIIETLERNASLHKELLERHLTKHLSLLAKG